MTTLVVIQARMGSSRLPGKVALPLAGAPLLVRMVERVRAGATAQAPFDVCVATSTLPEDDRVVELAEQAGVPVHRGHPLDCLNRHVTAARAFGGEHVVKIPSDCPLIDPGVIGEVLSFYFAHQQDYDYVSNLHPGSWPDGNDVEVMPFSLLELADREATRELEREHTTPFFWENPQRFRVGNVRWSRAPGLEPDLSMSHRFTIDYPEDYAFISAVYDQLYQPGQAPFSLDDILKLAERRPDIPALNAKYAGVNWYRHHLGELKTVTPDMTRMP